MKRQIKHSLESKKVIKKKSGKVYVTWKGSDNLFNRWIDKKNKLLYQMSYFPESDSHNRSKIKVELDLFNYTKKSNLNEESGIYTSEFAKKSD